MSEFNLSEKKVTIGNIEGSTDIYEEKDVKEFIKILKEELSDFNTREYFERIIDKLAGDKLNGEKEKWLI